jgi:pimeloyl-ACP methyl ester carboxylesterase
MTSLNKQEFESIFRHHYAEVNGVNLHYVMGGNGDPALLLHGWPQTWYEWRKVMPALAQHYTVIAPDLRGWGELSKPDTGYDGSMIADDIRLLVQSLGYERVSVVGHDWGVPVGYLYTAAHPESVRRFAAIEASVPGAGSEDLLNFARGWNPLWFFPFLATPKLPEQLLAGKGQQFFTWILRHMTFNPSALTDEDINEYLRHYDDPLAIHATCEYYRNTWKTAEQIRERAQHPLTLPAMAIGGDKSLGERMIRIVQTLAPQAQGVIINECRHLVPEEHLEELAQLLLSFIQNA